MELESGFGIVFSAGLGGLLRSEKCSSGRNRKKEEAARHANSLLIKLHLSRIECLDMLKRFSVTIDTNCINTKQAIGSMNTLEEWHQRGIIEIVKTDVMDTELPETPKKYRNKSQRYHEDLGEAIWDHSRWDHAVWGAENNHTHREMREILFPEFRSLGEETQKRATRDTMHLATYYKYRRDLFVTRDKNFIEKRDELQRLYGVIIVTPEECVKRLDPLVHKPK